MKTFNTAYGVATIQMGQYSNNTLAILLQDDTGAPLAKLSVNITESSDLLGEGEFFAKTWSENQQIALDALGSGLFTDTGKRVPAGFCTAEIWKINF